MAESGTYTGLLVIDGTIEPDITFGDGEPIVAAAGETVEFEFTVPEDGVSCVCTIAGHADAGMTGVINTPSSAAATGEAAAASVGAASHGGSVAASVEADPAAPPYEQRDPTGPSG